MRRILVLLLVLGVGVVLGRVFHGVTSTADAQQCASVNGDVNADDAVNLADPITLLTYLFPPPGGPPPLLPPLCATGTGLPDTGQTTCYDQSGNVVDCATGPCPGQDGAYDTGCPTAGRFIDNGNGTVTDTCTGLMWQKDTGFGGVAFTWCDALTNCELLEFAGHTDWRLPNVRELQSIVDYEVTNQAIHPVFGALSSWYWSSTSFAGFPEVAWIVYFNAGHVDDGYKDNYHFVRAVRSGP